MEDTLTVEDSLMMPGVLPRDWTESEREELIEQIQSRLDTADDFWIADSLAADAYIEMSAGETPFFGQGRLVFAAFAQIPEDYTVIGWMDGTVILVPQEQS